MRHSWIRSVSAAAAALLTFGGIAIGAPSVQAETPAGPAPYTTGEGMTHWVGQFKPGSDLEHYADWVLDQVDVPEEDRASRKPDGYLFGELDMVWLYLTPSEADKANGLIGQAPMVAAETTSPVSLPTPVDSGGPMAAPGQLGFETVPTGIARIGTPLWGDGVRAPTMGDVKVAVVDTGVDARHTDLHVVGGFNCSQDSRGPAGFGIDAHGHGTHVAGTIGAKANDEFVVGAAPGVNVYSEVTFDSSGSASGAMVLCAVNKALEHDVDIISASLGGGHVATTCGGPSVYTNGWCRAATEAIVVVAAGNDAMDAINAGPANIDSQALVTVGAIVDFDGRPGGTAVGFPGCGLGHRDDYLASFSNFGSTVDVVAPGGCILSTLPAQSWGFSSGTSMATPAVAGVFANFLSRYPGCEGAQAVRAVVAYADRFEIDYDGWPGADPPPMIRYVEPDRAPTTDPEADPCRIPTEAQS